MRGKGGWGRVWALVTLDLGASIDSTRQGQWEHSITLDGCSSASETNNFWRDRRSSMYMVLFEFGKDLPQGLSSVYSVTRVRPCVLLARWPGVFSQGCSFCPFPVTSLSGTGWPHQAQLVPIQKFCRHQKLPRTPTFDNPDESLKSRQISHNGQVEELVSA